jgi:hypothetical protein
MQVEQKEREQGEVEQIQSIEAENSMHTRYLYMR